MNFKPLIVSTALAAVLACAAPVHAQILGGNATGGLGGTLSGGLGGITGAGNGRIGGTLDADTDVIGSTVGRTTGAARGAVDRAGETTKKVRDKTRSAVGKTRDTVGSVTDQARGAVSGTINGSVETAGSVASQTQSATATASGAASGTINGAPQQANSVGSTLDVGGALEATQGSTGGTPEQRPLFDASGALDGAAAVGQHAAKPSDGGEKPAPRAPGVTASASADAGAEANVKR